jgi:hypothetical protein
MAMVQQINRSMQFFLSSSVHRTIDSVVLAGGCASIPGVDRLVEKQLGYPTIVANPFVNMSLSNRVKPQNLSNDAPAMMAATVGMAIGQNSDVTAEAAGVVIMDNSLTKVDEFMHISRRMRRIALQSAVGGMALSMVGMAFAATGHLSPVNGAIAQEIIDVLAVLNALRAALPPKELHDL